MAISDKELNVFIHTQAALVEAGGVPELNQAAEEFKKAGVTANMHVGDPAFANGTQTDRMRLEWYAGQLVEMAASGALFAVNSWLNCRGKFAY